MTKRKSKKQKPKFKVGNIVEYRYPQAIQESAYGTYEITSILRKEEGLDRFMARGRLIEIATSPQTGRDKDWLLRNGADYIWWIPIKGTYLSFLGLCKQALEEK